jgi:hypothetical protein
MDNNWIFSSLKAMNWYLLKTFCEKYIKNKKILINYLSVNIKIKLVLLNFFQSFFL